MELVLSDLAPAAPIDCLHEERDAVLAVAFHLRGGFRFRFEKDSGRSARPLDCWIGGAPRGAISVFRLPEDGFRTVSIRMSPDAALGLFEPAEPHCALLHAAGAARERIVVTEGRPMDGRGAATAESMLGTVFDGAARRLHLESCALSLLARQLADPSPSPLRDLDRKRMRRACEHLDARLDDPPTLLELARLCGVNDFKLKRDFKLATGVTVFGYLRERRLERAAERLRQGLSVQQAAFEVGYACPSRFAQAFRKRYGVVPSVLSGERAPA